MQFDIVNEWDDLLDRFPEDKVDIYFYKRYVCLYENDNKALCAVAIENEKVMIMPFLRAEINGMYDFETAYGYGGPVSNTEDDEWNKKAFIGIYDHLKNKNYLCGFIRCHPLLNNERSILKKSGERSIEVIYDRKTIAIDTSQELEDIWSNQIHSKNRNMIRKAEKNGLTYKTEYDFESYQDFINLYNSTMKRLSADAFYFFKHDYFIRLREDLKGNAFLGTVRKDNKLVCAAIFMYSKDYGHYHLEGSDREYSNLGANNLLLWRAADEMHRLGVKEFHLGGGTGASAEDSLYRFKKVFSNRERDFYIVKEIFDQEKYSIIAKEWEKNNREKMEKYGNFLLRYRY